jgi:ribosomal protein S18 acetylase RimI-like enzyme
MVHPDLQGRGIGTRLMVAIEQLFPEARRFELFTGSLSVRNIALYKHLGYETFTTETVSEKISLVFMEKYR